MLDVFTKMGTVRVVRLMQPIVILLPAMLVARASYAQDATALQESSAESAPSVGYSLRIGAEAGARWFSYSDPLVIATNLRPYDVVGVPLLTLGGGLRPFAWTRQTVLDRLEIRFDYAFAPKLESSTTDGQTVTSTWDHGDALLFVPVRLGKHMHAPTLGARLGYGWLDFSFAAPSPLSREIPTVTYRFLKMGLNGEMALTKRLFVSAGFDYLATLSGGAVYNRFRDTSIGGIDAQLGVGVNVASNTRLLMLFDYTRFFSSFVPIPGDAYVAGGALDQYGTFKIGIEYGR